MRASIVIATYNEGDWLGKTVQSCLETTAGLDCEVVVADDASDDGSVKMLTRRFPQVRVLSHAERRGTAPTKDLAARAARGEVLVCLDGHCKPEPGAIAALLADVEALDGAAVVVPRVGVLDPERWETNAELVGHGCGIDLESFETHWIPLEELQPHPGNGRRYYDQPALIGCCIALSRRLYERLWGWDTGMRGYGTEDVDFGLKAWLMGHPVLHDPEPLIGHRFRNGFDTYPVAATQVVANRLRIGRKHFSDPQWFGWLERYSSRQPAELWEEAWERFLDGYESVERERAYLMANRVRDELCYAATFGLPWPPVAAEAAAAWPASFPADHQGTRLSPTWPAGTAGPTRPPVATAHPTRLPVGTPHPTRPPVGTAHPTKRPPATSVPGSQ
jgi:GT2 family glycosyltransferase